VRSDDYGSVSAGRLRRCIYLDYRRVLPECALVTATDRKHAPYLFNTVASIESRFPDHPVLHVFDLGMSTLQRKELSSVPWIKLRAVEQFAPHWKQNWSWKPYILTQIPQRYAFYFDASNIVLYRPLILWFWAIVRSGYFLIRNDQQMHQITPPEYYQLFGCEQAVLQHQPTFGAGLMGFDLQGFARAAIDEVLERTIQGWNLGRSAQEVRDTYDYSVIRQCECFRADQTLFNLALRKRLAGDDLILRDQWKYCGQGGPVDHPRQYLWYSRRQRNSLLYFWRPIGARNYAFLINRLASYCRIASRFYGGRVIRFIAHGMSTLRRPLSIR
jgi:hypothetical protein